MARHRAISGRFRWHHRSSFPVPVPAQRPGIDLVDALTKLAHRVSPDELLAGRSRGNYRAICGARLLAASMVEPGRGRCQRCGEQVVS
ncbi:MAG: hypothetical protein ACRDRA_22225 [Pseudonocardiaceae bacterium]